MPNSAIGRRRLISVGLFGGLLAACSQPAAAPPPPEVVAPPPTEVTLPSVPVRRGDLVESIIVNSQLAAARETTLFFRQTGRLKNLIVSSGDRVKAGQTLAEVDSGNLISEVSLAELAMRRTQIKLEQARATGADRFALQLAQTDYDSARVSYERLRQQLEETRLISPYDGLVTETVGRPGEMISAYTAVVTVADPTELQVVAQLANAADGARLALGQPATLVLDKLPNARLPLQVVQLPTLAATLANGTPTPSEVARRFKLNPTQPFPKDLEIGMLGRVTVVLREKQGVLMVKTTAIRNNGPRWFVQAVRDGRKRDIDVEIGIMTPTDSEIVAGLREGDRVLDGPAGAPTPVATPTRR
jgi:RND family efflux transporter MFP subunit